MAEGQIYSGSCSFLCRTLPLSKTNILWDEYPTITALPFHRRAVSVGRDRQTFRQGFKVTLLKVPEGFSNTNFPERQLKVSETWALKSSQRFSYKLPSVLENLIHWLCLHCTVHLKISNQSCKYLEICNTLWILYIDLSFGMFTVWVYWFRLIGKIIQSVIKTDDKLLFQECVSGGWQAVQGWKDPAGKGQQVGLSGLCGQSSPHHGKGKSKGNLLTGEQGLLRSLWMTRLQPRCPWVTQDTCAYFSLAVK